MYHDIKIDFTFLPETYRNFVVELASTAASALDRIASGSCKGGEFTGWYHYPRKSGFALTESVKAMHKAIDFEYDTVVVIGIGGSYLGTRAAAQALGSEFDVVGDSEYLPIVYAGHHLSAQAHTNLFRYLETRKPIVNVISKSGTTTEPAIAFRCVRDWMERRFGKAEANARIIATTDAHKGALRTTAVSEGWTSFVVPDDVGGRFSVLTAVGLVPLDLAGYDIDALMNGADAEFKYIEQRRAASSCLQYAAVRNICLRQGKVIELLAYMDPSLNYLVEWWKQLYGESEGKEGKGIFPSGLAYTTDLHSMGQFVQEGARNLFETFLSFAAPSKTLSIPKTGSNLDELLYLEGADLEHVNKTAFQATKIAHYDGGVPCIELQLGSKSAYSLGQLFAFFETACAVSASLLGVNAFDQPGVEAYKKNLFALLGKPGYADLAAKLDERL